MHANPGSPSELSEPAERAVSALMQLSKVVTAAVAHSLAVLDSPVTVPQLRVLVMVGSQGPVNVTAVAEALGVNPSSASRTCERLTLGGLMDRREAPTDRRQVELTLTADGELLIETLLGHRRLLFEAMVAEMPAAEQQRLARGLSALNATTGRREFADRLGPDGARQLNWLL